MGDCKLLRLVLNYILNTVRGDPAENSKRIAFSGALVEYQGSAFLWPNFHVCSWQRGMLGSGGLREGLGCFPDMGRQSHRQAWRRYTPVR